MTELWRNDAITLASMIARKEVSSVEVVDAHLDRIEVVNPRLNAVTTLLADDAREAARRADQAVASGAELGPLHGVPCTVKQKHRPGRKRHELGPSCTGPGTASRRLARG